MEAEAAKLIGAGLALIGALGPGIGLGMLTAGWLNSLSRNPSAAPQLQQVGFIGLALTEAIALFALAVALILLFVV